MKRVTLPKILTFVADALRGKGGKFMVGAGITYADICFGSALHGVRKRFGCQVQKERECYHAVRLQNRYIKATIRQPTRSQTQTSSDHKPLNRKSTARYLKTSQKSDTFRRGNLNHVSQRSLSLWPGVFRGTQGIISHRHGICSAQHQMDKSILVHALISGWQGSSRAPAWRCSTSQAESSPSSSSPGSKSCHLIFCYFSKFQNLTSYKVTI